MRPRVSKSKGPITSLEQTATGNGRWQLITVIPSFTAHEPDDIRLESKSRLLASSAAAAAAATFSQAARHVWSSWQLIQKRRTTDRTPLTARAAMHLTRLSFDLDYPHARAPFWPPRVGLGIPPSPSSSNHALILPHSHHYCCLLLLLYRTRGKGSDGWDLLFSFLILWGVKCFLFCVSVKIAVFFSSFSTGREILLSGLGRFARSMASSFEAWAFRFERPPHYPKALLILTILYCFFTWTWWTLGLRSESFKWWDLGEVATFYYLPSPLGPSDFGVCYRFGSL